MDGFKFPGHTEFLAALDSHESFPVMMLANEFLRVVPFDDSYSSVRC